MANIIHSFIHSLIVVCFIVLAKDPFFFPGFVIMFIYLKLTTIFFFLNSKNNIKNWPIVSDWWTGGVALSFLLCHSLFITSYQSLLIHWSFFQFHWNTCLICLASWLPLWWKMTNFAGESETSTYFTCLIILETFTIWCSFSLLRVQFGRRSRFPSMIPTHLKSQPLEQLPFFNKDSKRMSLLHEAHHRKCESLLWDNKKQVIRDKRFPWNLSIWVCRL